MEIEIPRRRSQQRTLIGILVVLPMAYQTLRIIFIVGYVLFSGPPIRDVGAVLGALAVGILVGLLAEVPLVLAALGGLHLLFGSTWVEVGPARIAVRLSLGKGRVYIAGADLHPGRSVANAVQDSAGRWMVRVESGAVKAGTTPRPVAFGAGDLTQAQAVAIADAVRTTIASIPGEHG